MSPVWIAGGAIGGLAGAFLLSQVLSVMVSRRMFRAQESRAEGSPLIGKPAPECTLRTLDGREVSLSELRSRIPGQALIVNFWATWCAYSKREMPWLAQLREQYREEGFEVLGIVTDGASEDKVRQVTGRYDVRYPILRSNPKAEEAWGGVAYLPASFYINRWGRVVLEAAEASSMTDIEREIRRTLAAGGN